MPQPDPEKKLMMELEERLYCDKDGALLAAINERLDAIDSRLEREAKKLQPKKTHQEIAAARQAVQGAAVALKLIQAIHN